MGVPTRMMAWVAGLLVGITVACDLRVEHERGPAYSRVLPESSREFIFAVYPVHNPSRMAAIYGPIVDHLNQLNEGFKFRFETSHDYTAFERKLARRQVHFALSNPYQALSCRASGYRIFGKMGDNDQYRGIILVRRDSGIRAPGDLKKRTIGYPARTALAATLLPQYYLQTHGVDLERDTRTMYVRSEESVIMNVYLRLTDAGATWAVPWEAFRKDHPAEADALAVRWSTPALPNNGLVVRDDVPDEVLRQVEAELFSLHQDPEGQTALARIPVSRFEPATDGTYAPVQTFLMQFKRRVRPLNG